MAEPSQIEKGAGSPTSHGHVLRTGRHGHVLIGEQEEEEEEEEEENEEEKEEEEEDDDDDQEPLQVNPRSSRLSGCSAAACTIQPQSLHVHGRSLSPLCKRSLLPPHLTVPLSPRRTRARAT